jgi:hypothetical protein
MNTTMITASHSPASIADAGGTGLEPCTGQGTAGVHLLVAGLFAVLVLLLWAPFGPRNGMPYETSFAFMSQTSSAWDGFFYSDPLRVYTSVFYHLSYLLSKVLGIKGSFLPYQLVYAGLWWGRGYLVFLAMRRLLRGQELFSYFVGALVRVHASDHALNWVGQMNQFGLIFWMVLSLYLLICSLDGRSWWRCIALLLGAMFCCYLSLWSYESQLFIICAAPLLLLFRYGFSRKTLSTVCIYFLVPLTYIALTAQRYLSTAGGSSYQESVLRKDFTAPALLSDLGFNIVQSLDFTSWGVGMPRGAYFSSPLCWTVSLAAAFVLAGGVWLIWRRVGSPVQRIVPSARTSALLLGAGVILLVLSFPAYVILSSARMLWRTQFLSGIGAALVLAAAVGILLQLTQRRVVRLTGLAVAGALVAFFGVRAAYACGEFHYGRWERQRLAIAAVLAQAPRVRPGTVVVLTGVPKEADPFGDNMWFDMALRLAYPRKPVAGAYFYSDGTRPPGSGLQVQAGQWHYTGVGFPPMFNEADAAKTVVLRYDGAGHCLLLEQVPSFVTSDAHVRETYNPQALIFGKRPAAMARQRYLR